jgi:hypothetical protein
LFHIYSYKREPILVSTETGDLPRKKPGTGNIGDLKKGNTKLAPISSHLMFRDI